jgi:hypothetical protein
MELITTGLDLREITLVLTFTQHFYCRYTIKLRIQAIILFPSPTTLCFSFIPTIECSTIHFVATMSIQEVEKHHAPQLKLIANALASSKKIIVVSGAGISTNCGIPVSLGFSDSVYQMDC